MKEKDEEEDITTTWNKCLKAILKEKEEKEEEDITYIIWNKC